jgi:ABC-type transport system involved in multi-copper enzyme maturation permease subunit
MRMLNLLYAEIKKTLLNYRFTGFLVWVFPVGIGVFHLIAWLSTLVDKPFAREMALAGSTRWTTDALAIWNMISSFPAGLFGRMLPIAFIAVMFAGEYEWRMWKNLAPRRRRAALMLSKFAVLTAVLVVSFLLTSIAAVAGQAVLRQLAGLAYGPEPTGAVLSAFATEYLQTAFLGIISLLILAGAAALAAILTRSVLGAMLLGFGFSVLDSVSFLILALLGHLFRRPELVGLFRFTASYNLENAMSWLRAGSAYVPDVPGFTGEPALAFSLALLFLWAGGLIGLAVWAFRRQDITS